MNKIISFIKNALGISQLENKISQLENKISDLESKNKSISRELDNVRDVVENVLYDNSLIKGHLKFINKEFSVISDISPSGYDPSVVIIMKRGNQEIVKTYEFRDETMEGIYRMLEGFGEENNRIDRPMGTKGPNFRY